MENEERKGKSSSFARFLEGYKSRNIGSIEHNINFKINEIINISNKIIKQADTAKDKPELIYVLKRSVSILREKKVDDIISQLYSYGESLKTNINTIKVAQENNETVKEMLSKLIYNFVELAKMSEDRRLIDLAIEIGKNFL